MKAIKLYKLPLPDTKLCFFPRLQTSLTSHANYAVMCRSSWPETRKSSAQKDTNGGLKCMMEIIWIVPTKRFPLLILGYQPTLFKAHKCALHVLLVHLFTISFSKQLVKFHFPTISPNPSHVVTKSLHVVNLCEATHQR